MSAVVLLGWGLFCLLRAPVMAARYRRVALADSDWPDLPAGRSCLLSPAEWRLLGGVWCLFGLVLLGS